MSELWNKFEGASKTLCLEEIDEISTTCSSPSEDISIASDTFTGFTVKHPYSQVQSSDNCLQPLFPEKIRWFYKENKSWIPFCGYDSLRLETKYRELSHHTTLSKESTKEKIVVRGDLFEVDVLKRMGFPIYWTEMDDVEESFPILRGTWFRETSWQPLETENIADEIEVEHLKLYGLKTSIDTMLVDGLAQQISNKLHLNVKSLVIGGYHIDWYDQDNVFIYADSASHFIRQKIGLTKVGSKISRGYKNDARIDDKIPDITHLVFVVHGIGQKMKGGDITFQVSRVRSVCRKVTRKFFPLLEGANQRVEFLPVEWRKSLILDGATVDLITPNRNKVLRNAVNTTALDILYYSSPIYRPEMIGSLRSELNRLYSMFCARSPYFENKGGKVSVLAHSLGSVLLYDILTNWSPAKIYEYLETLDVDTKDKSKHDHRMKLFSDLNSAKDKVHQLELLVLTKAEQENTKRGQTNFRVPNFPSNFIDGNMWKVLPKLENLFCIGSPLSVFLALRGLKPQNATTIDHILPENLCRRFFNIFHPADPVVYRMEPLINKAYENIEPVRIYRVDHPNKYPYESVLLSEIYNSEQGLIDNTRRTSKDDASLKSGSDGVTSDPLKTKPSLANKLMKFFRKLTPNTSDTLANVVVNQVMSRSDLSLLDEDSDPSLVKFVQRKKKVKRKSLCIDTQTHNNLLNFRSNSQSSKTMQQRYISSKRSLSHRRNLRRLSELQLQKDIEWYFNNSDKLSKFKTRSQSDISSDDETIKIETGSVNSREEPVPKPSSDSVDSQLKYRLDYKLPESRYESSYLSVLTSHTCYWNSPEVCMFMLTHIFEHLGAIGQPL